MSHKFSYDREIESAYIITINGNEKSEHLSKRCQLSCEQVGMPFKMWDAVKWEPGKIIYPEHLSSDNPTRYIKMTDCELTGSEFACALSHISLWYECIKLDKPIVILEHDAIFAQPLRVHSFFSSIHWLGSLEYVQGSAKRLPIPLYSSFGDNYRFICRAHAYAIDPQIAKNLLSVVIKDGVHCPLDIMIRSDNFSVQWDGVVYAYDLPDGTTITNRNKKLNGLGINDRIASRNDDLRI
jgi:hypothetical protein